MADVNGSVRVRGQARRERAQATRRRMLAAAHRLFAERGYDATPMEEIAREAEVAVQTVYFTFHTKAALLAEVVRAAVAVDNEPRPVLERPWAKEDEAALDGRQLLALLIEHGTEMSRRYAPLQRAFEGAAALDPEVAERRRAIIEGRRHGMRHWVDVLVAKGELRPGLTAEQAADILFVLHSPDTFLAFTAGCGWTIEEWKAWLHRALCEQLLVMP